MWQSHVYHYTLSQDNGASVLGWQDGSVGRVLAAKPEGLSSSPRIHIAEGEKQYKLFSHHTRVPMQHKHMLHTHAYIPNHPTKQSVGLLFSLFESGWVLALTNTIHWK